MHVLWKLFSHCKQLKVTKRVNNLYRYLNFILFLEISNPALLSANRGLLNESLSSIQEKAIKGDSHYQGVLSVFYKNGEKGLSIDIEESMRWGKLAAQKDGALGLCSLAAISLERGKTQKGQFLYDEAYLNSNLNGLAKSNDPIALYCLGMMEIDNPPRNVEKGLRHIQKSAEIGFSTAQATLGMIYFAGIGVQKDSKTAIKWCSAGARKQNPLAMFYLGMAYSIGEEVEANDDYSFRWIGAAAERGLVMAQLTLGMKLATGDGMKKDLPNAIKWFQVAKLNGSSEASLQLRKYKNILVAPPSKVYRHQNHIEAIPSKNSPLISSSEEPVGSPSKESNDMLTPEIVGVSDDKSLQTTQLNKTYGLSRQSKTLATGKLHYQRSNFSQAKKYFSQAADENQVEALRFLGIMHLLGQGVEIDYQVAKINLDKAIKLGDTESKRYLRIVEQFERSKTN